MSQPVTVGQQLWRPRGLPGVEVLHADNVVHNRDRIILHEGYSIKITVAGMPAPVVHYRGREADPCKVGLVTVVEPDEILWAPDGRSPSSLRLLIVQPELLRLSAEVARRPRFSLVHQDDPDLWRGLRALHRDLAAGEERLSLESELTAILRRLVVRHAVTHPRRLPPPVGLPALRRVREMLHDRLDANLSLDELAETAGCGKHHLLRSFRDTYGAPPHTYRTLVRLARARRMLASGRTAAEVAADVGYCDQSQLNRHFRRVWGISAGTYARAVR